ncbi:hypothetical protein FJZ18_03555 [Candidatus Pacearchaeota archaeon]|nr:hypothetical protein [Candidatus Pacearchaeota archaeon]
MKTTPFKVWWFPSISKNERLQQTSAFKPRWRIVFVMELIYFDFLRFYRRCLKYVKMIDIFRYNNILKDICLKKCY